MTDLATLQITGRAARLTLNRPDARNAMSVDLLDALHARTDALARAEAVSACVITGEGRAFCAGMDLKAIVVGEGLATPDLPERLLTSIAELTLKVRALPCLTIARVNGAAIGGGCGLACVCDLLITHADAKLGFPEVDLGVCPAVVAPWLVRKIGAGRARAVLLRGGVMSGAEAAAIAIADHAASNTEEMDAAIDVIVERITRAGPTALAATKQLLNTLDASLDPSSVLDGAKLSASVVLGDEAQASLRARLR